MEQTGFKIKPIGKVKMDDGIYLEIDDNYLPALNGLDNFSHLNVIWWCNLFDDQESRGTVTCHKPYKEAPAEMGIFATRSPIRPNPLAITVVSIIRIDGNKIYIPYIDAEDGTPLIDLKPYHPSSDRIKEVSVPSWCQHWPKWYEESASFDWESEFVNAQ